MDKMLSGRPTAPAATSKRAQTVGASFRDTQDARHKASFQDAPSRLGWIHDGRSPDLRVLAAPSFPALRPVGAWRRYPLTVAGAVTDSAPVGYTSPCSLFHPLSILPWGTIENR